MKSRFNMAQGCETNRCVCRRAAVEFPRRPFTRSPDYGREKKNFAQD